MAYEFSLDRKATVTLGAGSLLLVILVFAAGLLTGLTWQSNQDLIALQKSAVLVSKAPATRTQMAPQSNTSSNAPPLTAAATPTPPVASASAPATPPAEPPAAEAPAATSPPATPPTAQASAASPIPGAPNLQLAVQVGAFLEKANADKLAARLKEEGYTPQVVLGGHSPKQWNFVRVGPYHDWEEAAEIASVLSRDQSTQAVVRPIR